MSSIKRDVIRTVRKYINWFQLVHNMKWRKFMKTSYHKIPALVCKNVTCSIASYREKINDLILWTWYETVSWLFGWLIGWLVGWLVGWFLVGWLVVWYVGCLVGWLVGWLVFSWLFGWSVPLYLEQPVRVLLSFLHQSVKHLFVPTTRRFPLTNSMKILLPWRVQKPGCGRHCANLTFVLRPVSATCFRSQRGLPAHQMFKVRMFHWS